MKTTKQLHYHTQRIINRVTNNYNQDAALFHAPANERGENIEQPTDIQDLIPELEALFNSGATIALETNQGHEDDGGDCYQAYILKAEHQDYFNKFYQENIERDAKLLWQLCIFEYILANPSHFITLWAGPY